MPDHIYRVWSADEHEHDNTERTYGAYEPREAVIKHAERDDADGGYESSWPRDFIVRDLGESSRRGGRDNHGDLYRFSVGRESVPSYRTDYRPAVALELGIHDRLTAGRNPEYICACCHPIGFAGECDKCLCATGKRFFTIDPGGATYQFVARDIDHCKQLLREVGVEIGKEDGDVAGIDDPEFADLEWIEHTQEEARKIKCFSDDHTAPAQPLPTYDLGAWFCSDY